MKLLLLWLLLLLSYLPGSGPAPVRVAFTPLTKAAYEQANKTCVSTKPKMTFPLRKQRGRLVIPTAEGPKVFQDVIVDEAALKKGIGEEQTTMHEYLGYLPTLKYHLLRVNYYETSEYLLISESGQQLDLPGEPVFAPDMRHIFVTCMGIEYSGGQPNILQLLALRTNQWQQEWKLEPKTWEPYRACWTSANTLLLNKQMWTGKNPGTTFTYAKLTIQ